MAEHSNSRVTEPRALTDRERILIRWTLEYGATSTAEFLEHLERARVISGCDCGCASVKLEVEGQPLPVGRMHIIGDFLFGDETSLCGAFVFEIAGILAGLEVYGLAVDAPTELPDAHQLRLLKTGEHVIGKSTHREA